MIIAVREDEFPVDLLVAMRQLATFSLETKYVLNSQDENFEETCAAIEELLARATEFPPSSAALLGGAWPLPRREAPALCRPAAVRRTRQALSIEEAYRQVRRTGFVYGTPEELRSQLADIVDYLGTKDPIELGAGLLLEQAGYERTQVQLQLDLSGRATGGALKVRSVNRAEEGAENETF